MKYSHHFLVLCLVGLTLITGAKQAQAQTSSPDAVVQAVLFYSPSCGHCYKVVSEVLPPLFEKYGEQLFIIGVDVSQPAGGSLFEVVLQYYNLDSGGVPFLVVGDTYLVGSVDIPEKLPGLIDQYLAQGGVDWPAIPSLAEALVPEQATETVTPIEVTPTSSANVKKTSTPRSNPDATESPTNISATETALAALATQSPSPTLGLSMTGDHNNSLRDKFTRDLAGNILAVIVLIGMVFSVIWAITSWQRIPVSSNDKKWDWLIPLLCVIGLGVAGYLAYVEITHAEAVCGLVGDCNTVQQSEYARLFGLLPIGLLGIGGYVLILLTWVISRLGSQGLAAYARVVQLGLTTFGVLFSTYLTFIEPFVIGATCAWCVTSAIIMIVLFWLSLAPARQALIYLNDEE